MDTAKYSFKQLDESNSDVITELFASVFTKEPWNDDWSDENQLRAYIHDLVGQDNSLTFGLYEGNELTGVSMGHIKHWYTGTEYFIDELCISTSKQGQGIGTIFVGEIEKACREMGLTHLYLLTNKDAPAYKFYKKQDFYEAESTVAFSKDLRYFSTKPFETERLICRPFKHEDLEDMFKNWAADPNIQHEYGEPVYETVPQVRELLEKYIESYKNPDFYRWAIVEKSCGENIGQIAFCKVYPDCRTAEIEYCIGKRFWGKGYAGEALAGLIDFTFKNTDFLKLEAYHRVENTKSGRVLEKSQMYITDTVERFARENVSPHGEVCYCIDKDTYENK